MGRSTNTFIKVYCDISPVPPPWTKPNHTLQVTVGVRSEDWAKARALLHPDVRVVELTSDDAWIRDSGPTFVVKVRRNECSCVSGDG